MEAIKAALLSGRVEVIDADLSGCFDRIPHRQLLRSVAKRVSDGAILKLVRGWLGAPTVEPPSRRSKGGDGSGRELRAQCVAALVVAQAWMPPGPLVHLHPRGSPRAIGPLPDAMSGGLEKPVDAAKAMNDPRRAGCGKTACPVR
jgi:hypothetical protein